jgi:hypothetical protein
VAALSNISFPPCQKPLETSDLDAILKRIVTRMPSDWLPGGHRSAAALPRVHQIDSQTSLVRRSHAARRRPCVVVFFSAGVAPVPRTRGRARDERATWPGRRTISSGSKQEQGSLSGAGFELITGDIAGLSRPKFAEGWFSRLPRARAVTDGPPFPSFPQVAERHSRAAAAARCVGASLFPRHRDATRRRGTSNCRNVSAGCGLRLVTAAAAGGIEPF